MIPSRFEHHAPITVGEAVALFGKLGSDAKLLACGPSPLMPTNFSLLACSKPAMP